MKFYIFLGLICSLHSYSVKANLAKSYQLYRKAQGKVSEPYGKMIDEIVESGYYYTAVPFMKEYLVSRSGSLSPQSEKTLEKIIDHTGVQLFEKIPAQFLSFSKSPYVKYILAKRMFFTKRYEEALRYLSSISSQHKIFPYMLNLKASSYYMKGAYDNALAFYQECVASSKANNKDKQLEINKETCQAGIARSFFAKKQYQKAQDSYSLISKKSYIWPELLFEEAWNSYYRKDYNRTLGKLVTYKAPVLRHIFKPESFSLQALSFLKLCHYSEAKKISSEFSSKYQKSGELLRKYLLSRGNDYRYYYQLISNFEKNSQLSNELFYKVLSYVSQGGVFQELKKSLFMANEERKKLGKEKLGLFYSVLRSGVANSMLELQELIGEYVRDEMIQNYREIYATNRGMGFLRLEILNDRKRNLYGTKAKEKKGNVKNLKKAPYQYFWNFNGEFWADELGDYVFALKSECQK